MNAIDIKPDRCPTCGSEWKGAVKVHPQSSIVCSDPWHKTPSDAATQPSLEDDGLTEYRALEKADDALESAQDATRGGARVLSIRQAIAKRMRELEESAPQPEPLIGGMGECSKCGGVRVWKSNDPRMRCRCNDEPAPEPWRPKFYVGDWVKIKASSEESSITEALCERNRYRLHGIGYTSWPADALELLKYGAQHLRALCGGNEPHRVDGWQQDMLPPGTRPLCKGEKIVEGVDWIMCPADNGKFYVCQNSCDQTADEASWGKAFCRTTRPAPSPAQAEPTAQTAGFRLDKACEHIKDPQAQYIIRLIARHCPDLPIFWSRPDDEDDGPWVEFGGSVNASTNKTQPVCVRVSATAAQSSRTEQAKSWRCFHCDEVFTDPSYARAHFGSSEGKTPACVIKAGAEGSLLRALRDSERAVDDAWSKIHAESSDAVMAMHSMNARHADQIRIAEELGYERGLQAAQSSRMEQASNGEMPSVEELDELYFDKFHDSTAPRADGKRRDAISAVREACMRANSLPTNGPKCDICGTPLWGTMIGNGDGAGQQFAHPECFYRQKAKAHEDELEQMHGIVRDKDKTIADLRSQLKGAWANRDYFCEHINRIGKEVVGPRIDAFKGDNCAADAVSREAAKLVDKLESDLTAARESLNASSITLTRVEMERDDLRNKLRKVEEERDAEVTRLRAYLNGISCASSIDVAVSQADKALKEGNDPEWESAEIQALNAEVAKLTDELGDIITQRDILSHALRGGEITQEIIEDAKRCGLGESWLIDQRHEVAELKKELASLKAPNGWVPEVGETVRLKRTKRPVEVLRINRQFVEPTVILKHHGLTPYALSELEPAPPPSPEEGERREFEAWATNEWGTGDLLKRDHKSYSRSDIRLAWIAWQAARKPKGDQ